ncbi:MAG: hypothetical protein A2V77_01705 [Anaeromyxobacter sp. RBG_16_69_14]|nr:MAG: hypothetical protein A2V77_01705 [Anaeromyxobacter sp. RBG_16_69_14]
MSMRGHMLCSRGGGLVPFLAFVNLLPFRTSSGLTTDGARILMTVLPISPGAEAVMRSSVLSVQGRRPRDWDMSVGSLLIALAT